MIRASDFSWRGKLLLGSVAALGVGAAVGWGFYTRTQEPVLRFEQPEIDLRASPAVEGEPIEVVANLHNFGTVPLYVTRMPVS